MRLVFIPLVMVACFINQIVKLINKNKMENIKIEISVKEHIGFKMDFSEKLEMLRYILFEDFSKTEFNTAFRNMLRDLIETEYEFEKREDVIKALELINSTDF